MISSFLAAYAIEITASSIFLGGFSAYAYFKLKGNFNTHKLIYYNVSDRVIKGKKITQRISDKAGGENNKNETFFKSSR